MINALNKPSDEKNYADAAAQFAYRAYGFSGDQYNYIVSSIDKQFMEIIKMEMMYQEFIAQRGDYFEEKYPDDESKWESYAAWTNDLNKLNEDVAKAMDTMLDREILVSDSTVGSIRMKLDEFVKPEDMVSVRMKNENYHEKLTGEFYENEQPIIDAFNEGYLYLIEEYGWKSNADVITPFINFHRIAVPTPKTEENPSGIDIYYTFDTSQPHDAEEDWAWNSDDSVPENLRFYQFEEKIDLTLARDQHIPSCDFINLTKENYSDGQNQFSCAKNTAEFQSLFATGLFSALSSIPGDYLSEYLLTKKDTKTYIALSDYDFDYHDAWATSYTIFHVVDTTGQYPGSSLESSTLSAEKIQPDKSAGAYSAYTVILKNRPQEDGYYKTKVDVATNGVGDTELEMIQEDGTTCQENTVPSGKEVTLRFKAEGTTVLESLTLQRHNNTENPSEVTSEETLLTKDQIATLTPDEEGYYTYTCGAPYSNATFVLNGAVGHKVYVKGTNQSFEDAILLDSYVDYFEEGENVEFYVSDNVKSVGYYEGNTYKELALTENYEGDRKGSFVMPAKDITLYYNAVCKEHSYDNGFCTKCGGYQPADYNESTGSYEIGNGGQMFWFAALVNGDGEHTQIQEAKPDAHGVLVSDISLKNPADENYEWKPIGEFKGIFDGQNHTISDFSMTKVNDQSIGFFQNLMSDPNETDEAKKATLKNFTLNGTIVTTAEAASAVILSVSTGTSWGAAGTVGAALISVAAGMGAPLPAVAGAIVAGAYFGDKMSPLSDSTNMSAIATETNLYQHIGHMFYTTVPGFIVSCVVYFIAGAHFASDSQVGQVDEIINTLGELFNLAMPVGLLLLIPCVIVIAGSLMKKPTIPVMIISSAVAIVLAMLVQGFSFTDCAASMVSGFKMEMLHTSMDLENIVEQVPNLLQRGGMSSMMNTALMAFCGFSFIGALTVCGSMELILERIMKHIHGTGQLITLTVILGVIMITVIGEATVTFLMIGGMFRPEYIKRGLESKNLSRSLEDSITVVEPLVPWSLAGVYMTSVLGVPTVQYAPWAVLCYTGVIFAIIWGFTGFGIAKIKKGSAAYEEYLELSGKTE